MLKVSGDTGMNAPKILLLAILAGGMAGCSTADFQARIELSVVQHKEAQVAPSPAQLDRAEMAKALQPMLAYEAKRDVLKARFAALIDSGIAAKLGKSVIGDIADSIDIAYVNYHASVVALASGHLEDAAKFLSKASAEIDRANDTLFAALKKLEM
jgi:hypothetical protein